MVHIGVCTSGCRHVAAWNTRYVTSLNNVYSSQCKACLIIPHVSDSGLSTAFGLASLDTESTNAVASLDMACLLARMLLGSDCTLEGDLRYGMSWPSDSLWPYHSGQMGHYSPVWWIANSTLPQYGIQNDICHRFPGGCFELYMDIFRYLFSLISPATPQQVSIWMETVLCLIVMTMTHDLQHLHCIDSHSGDQSLTCSICWILSTSAISKTPWCFLSYQFRELQVDSFCSLSPSLFFQFSPASRKQFCYLSLSPAIYPSFAESNLSETRPPFISLSIYFAWHQFFLIQGSCRPPSFHIFSPKPGSQSFAMQPR